MAGKVYISEYCDLKIANVGMALPMGLEPAVAEQLINTTGTSAISSAFNAKTKFIRVHTDAVVSLLFSATDGASVTAVTTKKRMAANTTEYFAVRAGDKVAAIDNT